MVSGQISQSIMLMFQARDFEAMWYAIRDEYRNLGFVDPISDQTKIYEYTWITQQLRKYMFSKQDEIMGCDNLEDMVARVDSLIGKAGEYGDERKKVVYNFMRDHWLYEVRNYLVDLIANVSVDEEETEDE